MACCPFGIFPEQRTAAAAAGNDGAALLDADHRGPAAAFCSGEASSLGRLWQLGGRPGTVPPGISAELNIPWTVAAARSWQLEPSTARRAAPCSLLVELVLDGW